MSIGFKQQRSGLSPSLRPTTHPQIFQQIPQQIPPQVQTQQNEELANAQTDLVKEQTINQKLINIVQSYQAEPFMKDYMTKQHTIQLDITNLQKTMQELTNTKIQKEIEIHQLDIEERKLKIDLLRLQYEQEKHFVGGSKERQSRMHT